ncbi:MAG TPA: hypothetical protein VMD56_10035 [Steroidobacteraceae bacterium]|nr:hypothetical protein [Steroidobacteraceae bacterium]
MRTWIVALAALPAAVAAQGAHSAQAQAQGAQAQAAQGAQGAAARAGAAQAAAPHIHLSREGWRGGWETTVDGVEHILELRIRGSLVSGVYCTVCNDPTTVAFVDGQLGPDGLSITVTHVRDDGSTLYQDRLSGRLEGGRLRISGHSAGPGGGDFTWNMHRDPRGLPPPAPPPPPDQRPPVFHYQQPGPWQTITADRLVGVWLAGAGPNKQYFIIRRDGDTLRGVVCGPCDNPYSMGAIEDIYIQGDTVLWDICHEDWGFGQLPYPHQILAHIADHELRLDAQQPNLRRVVSMTLFGPVPFARVARSSPDTAAGGTAAAAGDGR